MVGSNEIITISDITNPGQIFRTTKNKMNRNIVLSNQGQQSLIDSQSEAHDLKAYLSNSNNYGSTTSKTKQ